jgi:hypothetical protein
MRERAQEGIRVDEFIKSCRFVVIFQGDAPVVRVAQGWDGMLAAVKGELGEPEGEPSYWDHLTEEIGDPESWSHDDYGVWHYHTEIGDGGWLNIYRVWDGKPRAEATGGGA